MNEIERNVPVGRGMSRATSRTLGRIVDATDVSIARVEARAEVDTAKVNATVAVTQHAIAGAQYITAVEVAMAEQTPAAMGRLRGIADVGAMALQQLVFDHANKQRRI